MDYEEDISRELIKCVVVGDTAVGKTRLICAKTCGQKLSLEQLMTVHVPTVWAIDQYRICRNVLEKSFDVIDGVNVSLRLWDTFGDHNNDRCYAYGRSDVIVLCYSVASPRSLEHAKTMWYPEIRRMCPNVPVLLVACKVDLRYLCLQTDFQQLLARRRPSPLKPIRPDHIVLPEEGRTAAREIGAFYYETSVYSHFGVDDVYTNAVRAALCRRRHGRLWLGSSLNSVRYPQIQAPYQTPRPDHPPIRVLQSHFVNDVGLSFSDADASSLVAMATANDNDQWSSSLFTDCVLVSKDRLFRCHRLILCAGSKLFQQLFVCSTPQCRECFSNGELIVDAGDCADENYLSSDVINQNLSDHTPALHNSMRDIEQDIWLVHASNRSCSHSTRSSVCSSNPKPSCHNHHQQQHANVGKRPLEHTCSRHSDNAHGNNNTCCPTTTKTRLPSFTESVHSSSVRRPSSIGAGRNFPQASSQVCHLQHCRNLKSLLPAFLPDCVKSLNVDAASLSVDSSSNCKSPYTCRVIFDSDKIKPEALLACLQFMYTGDVSLNVVTMDGKTEYEDLLRAADLFEMKHLIAYLTIRRFGCGFSEFSSETAKREFLHERNETLAELGFEHSLFTDVEFITANYKMPAHKFLLSSRSEVMKAMFSNRFRESCTSEVELPDVYPEVLFVLLNYLYYDTLNVSFSLNVCEYIEALELANRMCLCRLTNLLEKELVEYFDDNILDETTLLEEVLQVLEPAQMCNARQLSGWCLNYLSCRYKTLMEHHGRHLKSLSASNQEYLSAHRWPPIWCLKETELYEKALKEGGQKTAELMASRLLKRHQNSSGCLCFSSKASKRYQHNSI